VSYSLLLGYFLIVRTPSAIARSWCSIVEL